MDFDERVLELLNKGHVVQFRPVGTGSYELRVSDGDKTLRRLSGTLDDLYGMRTGMQQVHRELTQEQA